MMWYQVLLYTVVLYTVSAEYCEESLVRYLPDSSFSASSSYTNLQDGVQYGASRVKMVGDAPGSWVADEIDKNQYIQIDLLRVSVVTEILTKGRHVDVYTGCCQQYVTSYFVQHSNDNRTWIQTTTTSNTQLFSGNTNTEDTVRNKLGCPVIARYFRILPQSWRGHIAMRVDIRGCHIQADPLTSSQINNGRILPQLRDDKSITNSTARQRSWFDNLYSQNDDGGGISNHQPFPGTRQLHQQSSNTRVDQGSVLNNEQPPSGLNNQQPPSGSNNQQPPPGFNQQPYENIDRTHPPASHTRVYGGFLPPYQKSSSDNLYQQNKRESTTPPWFARDWDPSVFENVDESLPPWRRTNWGNEYPFPQQGVIAPKKNDRCIESCYNRRDGDYQSCRSCRVYISCSNGYSFDQRLCPGNLVWNDDRKICDWTSNTCP